MNNRNPVFTAGNFSVLKQMLNRLRAAGDPFATMLDRKLTGAVIVSAMDVPPDVVTIGTRVSFRTEDGKTDTRIVSDEPKSSAVGGFLSLSSPPGLALLGLAPGASCDFGGERVTVERIHFQPEANMRARYGERAADTPENRRATFRLVGKPKSDASAAS